MDHKNRAILGMLVLGLLAMGCSKKEQPNGGSVDEGLAAANSWLEVVDAQRYEDSWEQACAYFKGVVPKEQWVTQVAGVRGPLGSVLSREVASAEYTTHLPGAPDGEYVVIQYRTKFQNKATAIETVTPMRDPDGIYRVSGYYVR
ncbi:MAG: DUF4019 domain-containing protein [Deltaproteobacteria bacterium]|nr:DUF4019 domain-containing protein [Deltaproteobacteria bacterium]NND28177.1 DUF4019 domain-containing protein [Myxococcales bacterium]